MADARRLCFSKSWEKVLDVSPHLRSITCLQNLAKMCGGLAGKFEDSVVGLD